MDDAAEAVARRPSSRCDSGVELRRRGQPLGHRRAWRKRIVRYEQIIIDSAFKRFAPPVLQAARTGCSRTSARGAAVSRGRRSRRPTRSASQPFADKIAVTGEQLRRRLPARQHAPSRRRPRSAAMPRPQAQHRRRWRAQDPDRSPTTLHVIPALRRCQARMSHDRSPPTRSCPGCARGSAARSARPTWTPTVDVRGVDRRQPAAHRRAAWPAAR